VKELKESQTMRTKTKIRHLENEMRVGENDQSKTDNKKLKINSKQSIASICMFQIVW